MSGGSHDYICYQIKDSLCGEMEDEDLNELVKDLVDLTHDLEWYHSADISEEDYRKTATAFKEKWLKDRVPKKVYVVTAGAYSEFHICQVFLDKEKAEMYSLANNDAAWYDDHEVQEYETHDEDFNVDPSAKVRWQYKIEFRSGSNGWTSRIWKKFQRLGDVETRVTGSEVTLTLDEDNDEKALRIARERFAKLQYERVMNEPKESGEFTIIFGTPGSGGLGGGK